MTVAGARETVGSQVVQQTGIQALTAKDMGTSKGMHEAKSGIKTTRYHMEKNGSTLRYMAKIQEVSLRIQFYGQPLEQVQNHDESNVYDNVRRHLEQPESINDTYVLEIGWISYVTPSLSKSIALGEAISCRDSCLIALQNKQNEFEKYKAFNDRTIDYEILQTKLNETLGLLALKDIEIKEGLKTKAYEISVLDQKHDDLVKKSLLTKSQLEGYLKENTKVISDLKVKEEKDIDKMIEMDKQLKFLNEIVYTRNQSIQTIHMLAPKCATYNGRLTFANPRYLKKAQSEKPCLYEIPYDNSDHANRFAPEREETMTLDNESRSKLNKDKVKPYDYTNQNSLYEIFKGPSLEYLYQLERAKKLGRQCGENRVIHTTSVSRPQLKCYQVKDKVVPNNSQVKFQKKEVEDHHRISSISKKTKSVTACNDSSNSRTLNENAVCAECGTLPFRCCKPKRKANKSVATPHKKTVASDTTIQKSKSYYKELYENTNQEWKWWIAKRCPSGYTWTQKPLRTKKIWMPKIRKDDESTSISPTIDIVSRITNIVQLILFIVDSGCTKHMTGNLKLLCNFVEKFLGTVRFGNDQFAPILGYGDLIQGNVTIKRVYYVEGLNHNLFSVGQFCDADLEVAFRKSTCFVRDLQGNDLLTGSRGSDLYTISLQETTSSTPICFMAKASPTQAWLWHRRLSHLNFDYITLLSKKEVVNGLPKLKYVKDQLCSSCEMSKAKRSSFKTKAVPSSKGRLNLLHMDLCGPMRVASINGKKYILVIVDDYSRYTWTLFLRSKDETPEFLKKGLHAYFKEEGIEHQTSTPRTPEQNGVVERQNRTLVEAARTMLSASKLPLSFWAEAVATACYTQNRSIIISTHGKTAYHIINDRKPSIKHLHIFGCICYITRDGENLDKMKEKGDPCVMVGYSTQSKGYRVYNKRTRLIVESIHIKFDEIKEMMSVHISSGLVLHQMTSDHNRSELGIQDHSNEQSSSKLVPKVVP
ncbi:retrovirus-related pol polyprotein from transposon TNT 1-94 [Tanacetum coccineum]